MAKNTYPINAKAVKKWLSKAARINITCKENFVYLTDGMAAVKFPAICWGDIAQDAVKMPCPADGESYEIRNGITERASTDVCSIYNGIFTNGAHKVYNSTITVDIDEKRSARFFVIENGEFALINTLFADIINYNYPGLNTHSNGEIKGIMADADDGNFSFVILPINSRSLKPKIRNAYSEMAKALLENLYS